MKITALMENNLCDGLIAEHGLSVYVETARHHLLVDGGPSDRTWENAKTLGTDLSDVDTMVLSHGHYDHSGGLLTFVRSHPQVKLYLRRNAPGDYFRYRDGELVYIGIDKAIADLPQAVFTEGDMVLDEELSLFTDVRGRRLWPDSNRILLRRAGEELIQDDFSHEQYLVIREDEQLVLISGCAHNGILNILDRFREIYGRNPSMVISGFHMIKPEYTGQDIADIRDIAEELAGMETVFYTGHCTGAAYDLMKEIMGDRLRMIRELR